MAEVARGDPRGQVEVRPAVGALDPGTLARTASMPVNDGWADESAASLGSGPLVPSPLTAPMTPRRIRVIRGADALPRR